MAMDAGGESVPVSFVHFATSRGGDGSRQVEKFERAERTCFRGRKVEGNDELLELVGAAAASRWELKVCDKGELGCRGQVEFSPFKPPTGEDVREAGVFAWEETEILEMHAGGWVAVRERGIEVDSCNVPFRVDGTRVPVRRRMGSW
uniref:Uncharacterized protein n=1 Tax=Odontella aurita TaxID=265563 RepID=A0A7S4IQ24_9STRA|mmetsp:Transcript_28550/g.84054  ORF Transcript_28550/g.84054 Transcript_28550/m.84054 type:complete len:147 (+) Transcript_28550:726-1166(+)